MFPSRAVVAKALVCFFAFLALAIAVSTPLVAATPVAPVLVPYTITAIAGNTQSSVPGYGGDGVPGLNATLNGPGAIAVDSVGNVYIADQANALIRELNAQTGVLETITGVAPTGCTGTTCTVTHPGCADGVAATGSEVGSRIQGLVVDGYGNIYFSDYNYQAVWVIYHGGTQVANFIQLVDATGVTTAGGVIPGYVYHIAGIASPKAGGGCSGSSSTITTGTNDNVLATKANFHDPLQMGIDPAGNLYVQDFANSVVRVINTQSTTQTFFGVSVQPGYMAAIVGCNSKVTTTCPASTPPFGGSAGGALFSNELDGMTVDQFGNIYELDTKGATGSIYAGVAYAGGSALANLINLESGLTATPGDWYEAINDINSTYATGYINGAVTQLETAIQANGANDIALRPVSIAVDPLGNIYMLDSHWQTIYRVDVNSQMASRISPGQNSTSVTVAAGSNSSPVYCSGTSGTQTFDAYGDSCPVQEARFNSSGTGYITFDAAGDLYVADTGNNIVRKVSLGTQFASTGIGSSLTQTLQLHFDQSNLPSSTTSSAFKITSGASDFSVSSVSCANYTVRDGSTECYVTIKFSPTGSGTRNGTLQASSASGGVYDFPLSGFGSGAQVAIDGGSSSSVSISSLGSAAAVATDSNGNLYVADPASNQVLLSPAGSGAPSAIGTGLKSPQGVAVDPAGDVYISDTGNNRIVKVAAVTGTQTTLTTNVSKPHGLALDSMGNLYVADTGNARVVEISPFGELSPSPLLAYTDAQALTSPVAVAVDKSGNIYVADTGNSTGLIKIAPGGGDLQPAPGGNSLAPPASIVSFGSASVNSPSGIAIDAAGDIYVSDSSSNTVQEIPAGSGPGSEPFTLNLSGLVAPGSLTLDPNGNLYIADTGNNRVLFVNRTLVPVNFGTVAQFQPTATQTLRVTNIGSSPLAPSSPFVTLSGATADFAETDTCAASNFPLGTLGPGLHCNLIPSFLPIANGNLSATASVQSGVAQLLLSGAGENPLVTMNLAVVSPAAGPTYGSPVVIALTATQSNGSVPTGTVTFNYTVNGVAQAPTTQALTVSGNTATTDFTINSLLPARTYVVNATYNGDGSNSVTNATPFTFTVTGLPLTVVANSVSYTYGGAVPNLAGTVTGILPADQAAITVSFASDATSSSAVGNYPIRAVLTGGNAANYTVPTAVTPGGQPAAVTENQAPLSIALGSFNITYGAPDISYSHSMTVTGLVNGDTPTYTFTPPHSSTLAVGTYSVVPTASLPVKGYDLMNNYKITTTPGNLVVAQGASAITIAEPVASVLPTALSSAALTITVAPPTFGYYGTPTGTVTLQDVFTPITSTGAGTSVTVPQIVLPLVNGTVQYTPTDPTLGTHVYSFTYSGDSNFLPSSTASPTSLIVDVADFTITSTSSPIQVAPGVTPGGDATQAGELAATPEIATLYIAPILGSTQTVNLTCSAPASYITCTLTPASIALGGKTTLTSVIAVSTPGTLPINYTSKVQQGKSDVFYAIIPLSLFTLLPFSLRRRRHISRLLLFLVAVAVIASCSACGGGNSVKFFTPVPAGPQSVTITGTSGSVSRSITVPINIQ